MSRIYSSIIVTALLLPLLVGGLLHPRYAYAAAVCSVQPTTISNSSQPFNFTASGLDANKSYQIFLNGVSLPSNPSDPSGNISTSITPAQFLGPIVSKIVVQLKQFPGSYVCNQGGTDSNLIVTVAVPAPPPDAKYYRCNPDKRICEETTRGAVGASTEEAQCNSSCESSGTTFTPTAPPQKQDQGPCSFDLFNPGNWIDFIICLIRSIINDIIKFFVGVASGLISFAIKINSSIYSGDKSIAKVGFDLSLQITNMLFAAGIIVIALGTMFRRSFGMALLPRFVLVALLIYFSFFAATKIIEVSDKVTTLFVNAANLKSGTFGPQLLPDIPLVSGVGSIFISIVFGILLVFTLFAVAVLFLIRYYALTILIILLPFALFFSIFPGLNVGGGGSLWGKWTENFTRWIIFGPVMAFFVYLAVTTLSSYTPPSTTTPDTVISSVAGLIAVIGLLLSGLMAANSLGVTGAAYFNNLAQGGINRVVAGSKNWAKRTALRATTAPLRRAGGKSLTAAMQAWQPINVPLPFGLRIKSSLGVGAAGTALSRYAQKGENLAKESGKEIEGLSSDRLAQLVPRLSGPTLIAALDKLQKSGDLDQVKNLGRLINDKGTESLFKNFASGSVYSKLEKSLGANTAALNAINDGDDVALNTAMGTFISKLSANEIREIKYNDIYSASDDGKFGLSTAQKDKHQEALALAIATENPGGIKSMLAGVSSANFLRAHSAIARATSTIRTTNPAKADELNASMEEMIKRRKMGDLYDATTTTPGPTPTAGTPPPPPGATP